jgi:hypothetical protein
MHWHTPSTLELTQNIKNLTLSFQGEELLLRMDELHVKNTMTSLRHGPQQHEDKFINKTSLKGIYFEMYNNIC